MRQVDQQWRAEVCRHGFGPLTATAAGNRASQREQRQRDKCQGRGAKGGMGQGRGAVHCLSTLVHSLV